MPRLSRAQIDDIIRSGIDPDNSIWALKYLTIAPSNPPFSTRNEVPFDLPFTLYEYHSCPRYENRMESCLVSPMSPARAYLAANPDLANLLASQTGYPVGSDPYVLIRKATELADPLKAERAENPAYLPEWLRNATIPDAYGRTAHLSDLAFGSTLNCDSSIRRAASGVLVNYILRDMLRKVELIELVCRARLCLNMQNPVQFPLPAICTSTAATASPRRIRDYCDRYTTVNDTKSIYAFDAKVLNGYFAHDTTLYALLSYLGIPIGTQPDFASSFTFELWRRASPQIYDDFDIDDDDDDDDIFDRIKNVYYVKLLYRPTPDQMPVLVKIVPLISFAKAYRIRHLERFVLDIRRNCM